MMITNLLWIAKFDNLDLNLKKSPTDINAIIQSLANIQM